MSYRAGRSPQKEGIPLLTEPRAEKLGYKTKPLWLQPLALAGLPTETEGVLGIMQGWGGSQPLPHLQLGQQTCHFSLHLPFGLEQSAVSPSTSPYSWVLSF